MNNALELGGEGFIEEEECVQRHRKGHVVYHGDVEVAYNKGKPRIMWTSQFSLCTSGAISKCRHTVGETKVAVVVDTKQVQYNDGDSHERLDHAKLQRSCDIT